MSNLYIFIALSSEFVFRIIQLFALRTFISSDGKFEVFFSISFMSQVLSAFLCLFSTVYFVLYFVNKLISNIKILRIINLLLYFSLYLYIVFLMPTQLQLNTNTIDTIEKNYISWSNPFLQMNYFNNMENSPAFIYSAIYLIVMQLFIIIVTTYSYTKKYINKCTAPEFIKLLVAFEIRELLNFVFYFHTFDCGGFMDSNYIFSLAFYYLYAFLSIEIYINAAKVNELELEDKIL
jgi:hypothetical protein